jgi:uncharacterized protein (DUF697 family)
MIEHNPQLAVRSPLAEAGKSGAAVTVPSSAHGSTTGREAGFARDLVQLKAIRDQCRALVTRSASLSGVAAIVPIPAADIGVDITLFLNLLPEINKRFGLSPEQIDRLDARTRELVFVSVTSIGSQAIGRVVTAELVMQLLRRIGIRVTLKTAAKWVPIIGQAAAATISFGAMRMVGNRHVEECYKVALNVLEARRPAIDVQVVA